jgi:uncharacterized protein (DUF488 family)
MKNIIYTIGYASFSQDEFISVLMKYKVNALVDVRSSPYSKFKPEFNKNELQQKLKESGIYYIFLGDCCGARIDDLSCYSDGKVDFSLVAKTSSFQDGIQRIRKGAQEYVIAIMCAEKDPITCHRMILICKELASSDFEIIHIIEKNVYEKHSEAEQRLLVLHKLDQAEFFRDRCARISDAYARQNKKIAYSIDKSIES